MKKIGILLALLSGSLVAQVITGHGGKFGPGRILVVDNCTHVSAGETNNVTNTTKNYVHWFATRLDVASSFTSCKVGVALSQSGIATGSVSVAIFDNNAGKPGNLIIESAARTNTLLTASYATNYFLLSTTLTQGVTYWAAVHFTDSVPFVQADNFYNFHQHFTGAPQDVMWGGDDAMVWADSGSRVFIIFQVLTPE